MNISGNINDNHGHSYPVNLYAPDPPRPQPVVIKSFDRHCHHLAKAGLWGLVALAFLAVTAGVVYLFCLLPRPVKLVVLLALFGWGVWSWATYRTHEDRFSVDKMAVAELTPAPRAQLVKLPEVRRAELVNAHPGK